MKLFLFEFLLMVGRCDSLVISQAVLMTMKLRSHHRSRVYYYAAENAGISAFLTPYFASKLK